MTAMKRYALLIAVLFLMGGCSILTPTCRMVEGPAELNVQGGASGGSVLAKVDDGGMYHSYPAMDGKCIQH